MPRLLVVYHASAPQMHSRLVHLTRVAPALRSAQTVKVSTIADAGDAIARFGNAVEGVAVAGGDGMMGLVASALLSGSGAQDPGNNALPLVPLPLGTGNAFAHGVGIRTIEDAIRAVELWHEISIDVMRTSHPQAPVALVTLSAGVEARFIDRYSTMRNSWGRAIAATASSIDAFHRRASIRLAADGVELCDPDVLYANAGLYNFPCYAWGKVVFPDARLDDGLGEAVAWASFTRYGRAIASGLRTSPACKVDDPKWTRFRNGIIACENGLQADGERLSPASVTVRIVPAGLRVIGAA